MNIHKSTFTLTSTVRIRSVTEGNRKPGISANPLLLQQEVTLRTSVIQFHSVSVCIKNFLISCFVRSFSFSAVMVPVPVSFRLCLMFIRSVHYISFVLFQHLQCCLIKLLCVLFCLPWIFAIKCNIRTKEVTQYLILLYIHIRIHIHPIKIYKMVTEKIELSCMDEFETCFCSVSLRFLFKLKAYLNSKLVSLCPSGK